MELLTLNVGCGNRVWEEYPPKHKCINYDIRSNLKNVDVIGDVRNLSMFEDEKFSYIIASDIIEHFKISEVDDLLTEWRRVLKRNCIIEFRLPNLEAIAEDYVKRKEEFREDMPDIPISHYFSWLLCGGQDYDYNIHYTQYDRRLFKYICLKNKLEEIYWKAIGYNMIVKCRRV